MTGHDPLPSTDHPEDRDSPSRRRILASLGTMAGRSVAGCSEDEDETTTTRPPTTTADTTTTTDRETTTTATRANAVDDGPSSIDVASLVPDAALRRIQGSDAPDPVTNNGQRLGDEVTMDPLDGLAVTKG